LGTVTFERAGELSVHAHADPNVFAIFPGDIKNTPGTRTVNVV
jgi:hypothetical protein